MKIDIESQSEFFWGKHFLVEPQILLGGKVVESDYILEADEEAGTVVVAKTNGSHPIYAGGRYLTETLTGKVEIKGEPRPFVPAALTRKELP